MNYNVEMVNIDAQSMKKNIDEVWATKIRGGVECPICSHRFRANDVNCYYRVTQNERDYFYYTCPHCESIFIEPECVDAMNRGEQLVQYNQEYWNMETEAAIERCHSVALARMAEAIYYCRIPINNFLDIGGGTGQFLDAVKKYLPSNYMHFYSIEKYPPEYGRTEQKNYIIGDYDLLEGMVFQCGICIEVVEHLTPNMLKEMFVKIAKVSENGALYLINSGFNEYVKKENRYYLDPFVRGHIISYSINGLRSVLEPIGFRISPVEGKTWLVACEYQGQEDETGIVDRIWTALPENLELLCDKKMGSVLKILGLESARAYV